jgi:hypothetical protein
MGGGAPMSELQSTFADACDEADAVREQQLNGS